MFESLTIGFGLVVLLASPFVARVVGWTIAQNLRVEWGHIRDWMPSVPNTTVLDKRAEVRWDKRTRAIEARLLRVLVARPTHVTAAQLAAAVGEDIAIVDAALDRIRAEIPCRLQVTRSGQMIHDFKAEDVQRLKRRQSAKGPVRFALFVLGVFANIGATWPMIMSVLVAGGALLGMAAFANPVAVGGLGLLAVLGLMLSNAAAGWFIHAILTPWGGPRLGPTKSAEDRAALVNEAQPVREYIESGSSSFDDVATSFDGSGCGAINLDGADEGCLAIVIAVLLVGVIVAFTAALGIWLRGIWRAVKKLGVPDRILSPAAWIRGSAPVDWVERFVPTNDLVLRVTRALRRVVQGTHTEDGGMVKRVMARATGNQGRVSALEVMLHEGVDMDEAMTIGARLSGYFGGEIHVGDEGEIEFVFPRSVLGARDTYERDLHAEFIDFDDQGRPFRRNAQQSDRLPLNIPGLSHGHLVGTDRLVAGTILMQFCAMLLVHLYPEVAPSLMIAVDVIFPLMTLGAFALSGAARYASSVMVQHGIKRDVRRAGFAAVNRALARGESSVDFMVLARQLSDVFRPSWKSATVDKINRELTGVAIDLDLEPDGRGGFDIASVKSRLAALDTQRQEPVVLGLEPEDADEVVFDTQVEHARAYALG